MKADSMRMKSYSGVDAIEYPSQPLLELEMVISDGRADPTTCEFAQLIDYIALRSRVIGENPKKLARFGPKRASR
jgi:hypothetical protein